MNPQVTVPLWTLIVPPVATVLSAMLAVMMAALYQNRALDRLAESLRIEIRAESAALRAESAASRAEMKQGFAELELRLSKQISDLDRRVARLEEQPSLVRT